MIAARTSTDNGAPPRLCRIEWIPGTDQLLGVCFCTARLIADEPAPLWEWLLGHPDGHVTIGG